MLRKLASSMLLTGAVLGSGSAGCGASSEPLGMRTDELVIEAPAQPEAAILGSGYDKTSGSFTKACVTGTGSRVGPSSSSLTLSRVTTLSSLESSMGFAGDLKARYAVAMARWREALPSRPKKMRTQMSSPFRPTTTSASIAFQTAAWS